MLTFPRTLAVCFLVAAASSRCVAAAPAAKLPDLAITLGEPNQSNGLSVPDAGDGRNVFEQRNGVALRRLVAGPSSGAYLYVKIDHPAYDGAGPRDLYVTVVARNDTFAYVTLQYDKAAARPDINSKYTPAEGVLLLTGNAAFLKSGAASNLKERSATFYLPRARLGKGQNFGADFRLAAVPGVGVRRITLSSRRPAAWKPGGGLDQSTVRALKVSRRAGMEFTIGSDVVGAEASLYRAISVTSAESYVAWSGVEPQQNRWDWSRWDKQVATLKAAKLKWVPFLLVGPAYATPLWFQKSSRSHVYKCLEHKQESRVQSLWNPHLKPAVERFLKAFADRYRSSGALESVLLGVTGIYGESIYPAGPEGGWTAGLTGVYHNHAGWWAGDTYARAAFAAAMRAKYKSVAALNRAWRSKHLSFASVAPFVPDKAPADAARADFVEWYQRSMTDWSVFWVRATRRVFPTTPIYLCTGGDGDPMLGADFTAQAKAIAPWGAGVRITNEGSDYAANFSLTREVATATRFYNTFCGFEPASGVSAQGNIGRIYNATASGARQLHAYAPNITGSAAALQYVRASIHHLVPRRPRVPIAIYVPRETWAVDAARIRPFYEVAQRARDLSDLDFVTRQSVLDGVLTGHKALLLCEAPVLEPAVAAAIERWVRGGGILIAATRDEVLGSRLHDNRAWRARVFAARTSAKDLLSPELAGAAPARWSLPIGTPGDENWLFGDWFSAERGAEWPDAAQATKRWSGARPGLYLPVAKGRDYTLRLQLYVPALAIVNGGAPIVLNGQTIGTIDKAGLQTVQIAVPRARLGTAALARLELQPRTWKPSEHGGGGDARALGIAVRQVDWIAGDAPDAAVGGAVTLRFRPDKKKLAQLAKRVGRGRTVLLTGQAAETPLLLRTLSALLRDTRLYWPDRPNVLALDGQLDGRFVTLTASGPLWFDSAKAQIRQGR